jgi:uncharacterized protein YggU (UPF0235/DUF167 family)
MAALPYEADADGLRLRVRLTPRGGRDALEGVEVLADGRAVLKARVRAAPEKGSANAALEKLIAKALGVPKSAVEVVGGKTSRVKIVRLGGEPQRIAASLRQLSARAKGA